MWNLCEASDQALKIIHQNGLIQILLKHLSLRIFGHNVVTTVLQCLFTISEDCQEPILSVLKSHETEFENLISGDVEKPEDKHVKLLAYGVAMNICQATEEPRENLLPELMLTIGQVLEQDQRKMVGFVSNKFFSKFLMRFKNFRFTNFQVHCH